MKKCDFCTESDGKGKCHWSLQISRQPYCEKAIKQMVKAMEKQKVVSDNG